MYYDYKVKGYRFSEYYPDKYFKASIDLYFFPRHIKNVAETRKKVEMGLTRILRLFTAKNPQNDFNEVYVEFMLLSAGTSPIGFPFKFTKFDKILENVLQAMHEQIGEENFNENLHKLLMQGSIEIKLVYTLNYQMRYALAGIMETFKDDSHFHEQIDEMLETRNNLETKRIQMDQCLLY